MNIYLRRTFVAFAVLATVAGCETNPVSGDRQLAVSENKEVSIGREADAQVRAEYGVYDNPAIQTYVNDIGQRLAQNSHRSNLQWKFTVVDSPDINAFALPGGYIYITRGMMAYLNSEAELAGVLGHEIGHVTARHGAQQQAQSRLVGFGSLAAELLGQVYLGQSGAGQLANQAGQGLWLLPNSREHELEADRLGAEYLQRIGQDPDTMITVLQVLKQNEAFSNDEARAAGRPAQRMPNYLSTHPSNAQRLDDIARVAAQYSGRYGDAGRNRYLQRINGMAFGDSAAQGLVRGRNFYHPSLGFALQAPSSWKIQNSAEQLVIISGDEQAAVAMVSSNTRGDLDAAIRKLQADSGRGERTTINGLPALYFVGAKQGVAIEATAITVNGNDYILRPLAKSAEARDRARNETQAIIQSVRAMSANDRAQARPYKLRTVTAGRDGLAALVAEAARAAPDLRNVEGQIRLLNQIYPAGEINPGQLAKTIQ